MTVFLSGLDDGSDDSHLHVVLHIERDRHRHGAGGLAVRIERHGLCGQAVPAGQVMSTSEAAGTPEGASIEDVATTLPPESLMDTEMEAVCAEPAGFTTLS
jgi:hypothetical protein